MTSPRDDAEWRRQAGSVEGDRAEKNHPSLESTTDPNGRLPLNSTILMWIVLSVLSWVIFILVAMAVWPAATPPPDPPSPTHSIAHKPLNFRLERP